MCAYGFLAVVMYQIASHIMLGSHVHETEEHAQVFLHNETDHHDSDCEFAIGCSDEPQHDDQLPGLRDENNRHHILAKEIKQPMAVVILGGIVTSTFLNLTVIPALYLEYGK